MSFFYGLIPTLLLFSLNPFNLGVFFQFNKNFTLGYGLVAFVYLFLVFSITNYIYIKDKIWNIYRVFILYIFILFTVSSLMLYYHSLGKSLPYFQKLNYYNMLSMIFLITLMPTIIVRLVIKLNDNKPQNHKLTEIKQLQLSPSEINVKGNDFSSVNSSIIGNDKEVLIKSILIKEKDISLSSDAILYIKSDNNYCHVYYLNENSIVENKMMRITLKQVENQLEGFDMFFRCHNSHIVNKNKIVEITGNSANRKIKILDSDYLVPISRKIDYNF